MRSYIIIRFMIKRFLFIIMIFSNFVFAYRANLPKYPSHLRYSITADDLDQIQENQDIFEGVYDNSETVSICSLASSENATFVPIPGSKSYNDLSEAKNNITEPISEYEFNVEDLSDSDSQDSTKTIYDDDFLEERDDGDLMLPERTNCDLLKQVAKMLPTINEILLNSETLSDSIEDNSNNNNQYMDPEELGTLIQNAKNQQLFKIIKQ